MNPETGPRRPRTLFLTYLSPSFLGWGTQIRAAALLGMLAARRDVYLLVITRDEAIPSPADSNQVSRKILYLRVRSDLWHGGSEHDIAAEKAWAGLPHAECKLGRVAQAIKAFYDENEMDSLFVFRLESYFLMEGSLDQFPVRYLDLDELASRRNHLIHNLKTEVGSAPPDPVAQRAHSVLRVIEKKVIPRFEKVFVSSEFEANEARRLAGSDNIHVLPNIFPPRAFHAPPPVTHPQEILFVGTLSYYPNEDAVRYFCQDIFPLIRRQLGDQVVFRIVGFACPPSLRVVEEDPGVHLMGFQEDLEPFYAKASLLVVPLRAGTGTRLKILEAFVHERPVVSTSIGAMGLKVTDGEEILLADEPEKFAQACLRILNEPELASRLVENGRHLHRESYSPETLARLYDEAMGEDAIPPAEAKPQPTPA